MKLLNKLVKLIIAFLMTMSMGVTAFADGGYTITVQQLTDGSNTNHTYNIYQIFTGTSSDGKLVDVKYGSNAALPTGKNVGDAVSDAVLTTITELTGSDAKKAAALKAYANLEGSAVATVTAGIASAELPVGYYLISDTTNVQDTDSAVTLYLVKVLDADITVTPKTDKPTVEKKVKENVKTITASVYTDRYNDVADYNIGDAVPFQLIGAVPDMSAYTTYTYTFTDTLSAGLTAPASSAVKVYLSSDKKLDGEDTEVTSLFKKTVDGQVITVSISNLKSIENATKGKYIIVDYTATLNSTAVIGLDGNENKVKLTYSNNPNGEGTGETPEDKVIVFTYAMNVKKVSSKTDAEGKEVTLADAEFVLSKTAGSTTYYAQVAEGKLTGWTTTESEATTLTTDATGYIKVAGLDDGTYSLKETKAPTGYNLPAEPFTVVISATTANGQNWDGTPNKALTAISGTLANAAMTVVADNKLGTVEGTIANTPGSTLPETGGIGTTIFYVVGGILMVGAGLLLVKNKKANN